MHPMHLGCINEISATKGLTGFLAAISFLVPPTETRISPEILRDDDI